MARTKAKQPRACERLTEALPRLSAEQRIFGALKDDHNESIRALRYAERTVSGRDDMLSMFLLWCFEREIEEASEVTKPIIERYQRHLYHHRKPNGKPMSTSAQCNRVTALKQFLSGSRARTISRAIQPVS